MNATENISITANDAFHCLTHFEEIDTPFRNFLHDSGYDDSMIDSKIKEPGSKFNSNFAKSIDMIIRFLQKSFPEKFNSINLDLNGMARLSFRLSDNDFPDGIGNCNVVSLDDLSEEERASIKIVLREGHEVKKVTMPVASGHKTNEINLIVYDEASPKVRTVFPGIFAPRFPNASIMSESEYQESLLFWNNHCFL